jgi:hypothetical protein
MSSHLVFVDRRRNQFRRTNRQEAPADQRKNVPERRDTTRTIMDDYYAYMRKALSKAE